MRTRSRHRRAGIRRDPRSGPGDCHRTSSRAMRRRLLHAPWQSARMVGCRSSSRVRTDAADGGEQWIGRTGSQGIAIDRSGFVLARRTAADEASIAQRTFTFVDASAHARIEALDPQPARVHHIGQDVGVRGETDQPTFARVRVADLYAGIDVAFHGTSGRLEYDVIVAPGADPGAFALRTRDASRKSRRRRRSADRCGQRASASADRLST